MECIIQNGALVKCILDHGETTVILPEGIHAIGRRAFYNNQQLVSVEIPDSVKHIGIAVFAYCRHLRSIKLPNGLKTIGRSAFWECDSLNHIHLPNSMDYIGKYAFARCTGLEEIDIPPSVLAIRQHAFHAYQKIFFPFHDLQQMRAKLDREPNWKDTEDILNRQTMMLFSDQPKGVMMTALQEYAEPYDWIMDQLKDWAYMVSTTYFFYKDGLIEDKQLRISLQEGMEAYGGVAPSFIILLREKPTLWWHFHSLHQCIHLTLSFMLADEHNPLRMCKYCKKIYLAGTTEDEWYCSTKCKKAYEENGD